jgi:tRNA threonylcarbamoyl adenosine modification protein (Sua5/YciO/YrdC/YwlC family)
MSQIIDGQDQADAVARTVQALTGGQLAVLPTDTVYSVVADAFQTEATRRIFTARGSDRQAPLTLLIRNPRQVIGLAKQVPETAERLMAAYWPGPLTIVLEVQPEMPWDLGDAGETVALRMPADDLVLAVAADVGPLACSGANRRGDPPPSTASEARAQLGEQVALYVDGGLREAVPSTIVDCRRGSAVVLREGVVSADHVEQVATGAVQWGSRPADHPEEPATQAPAAEPPSTDTEAPNTDGQP